MTTQIIDSEATVEYVTGRAVVPAQIDTALDLRAAITRHDLVVRFVKEVLVDGIDYGQIPGSKKPFLWKPGAEKLSAFFGQHPWVERVTATEDWEAPFFAYTYICKVMRGAELVATCEGASNSKEPCYGKQNAYALQNAVMKRAQKRALVGAVQIATSSTEFFAQSMDYIEHEDAEEEIRPVNGDGGEAAKILERLRSKARATTTEQDISAGYQGALKGKIAEALQDNSDKARHLLLGHIWHKEKVAELTYGEFSVTANWIIAGKDPKTGDYPLKPEGVRELHVVYRDAQAHAGQLEIKDLFGEDAA